MTGHGRTRATLQLLEALGTALDTVQARSGLVPVCAWCLRVRDNQGHWKDGEALLQEHAPAEITHGICPECRGQYARSALSLTDSATG